MQKLVSLVTKVPERTKNDDDFVDRLNHRYTVVILSAFSLMISSQLYIGKPITCWVPKHFTGSHTKYTNSYCWVKNTYLLAFDEEIPNEEEQKKRQELIYYQWLPFIFLLQAVFFYIPCMVWRALNSKAGVDADDILFSAKTFQNVNRSEKKDATLQLIVNQMDRFLDTPRNGHQDCAIRCQRFLSSSFCFCCGYRMGNYLVFLYIFVKMMYVANVFGQLFVLNLVLRTKYNVFGLEMLEKLIYGESWEYSNSTVFPHVTMCDFNIRRIGNVHQYTVQCVLPINMYAEKMYMFLWWWMVSVLALSCITLFIWMLRACMYQDRVQYIRGHLVAVGRMNSGDEILYCYDFVEQYLRQDGVFLIRLIGHNTNGVTVSEILAALWDQWRQRDWVPKTEQLPIWEKNNKLNGEDKPHLYPILSKKIMETFIPAKHGQPRDHV